ncbi:uncharacterized protein PG986_013966 [Apiospora aurea]|uniref:SET domain-containing protein n=1 Tax=Apiospora aurea TaxID=335848 RepID=A0ABR1PX29_9PEZI
MAPTAFVPGNAINRRRFREPDGTVIPGVWKTNEYRVTKPTWRPVLREDNPRRHPYKWKWHEKLTEAMDAAGPTNENTINALLDWKTAGAKCQVCGLFCGSDQCGQACYEWFRAGNVARLENECELRPLHYRSKIGGHGLFLRADAPASIQRGDLVGEYLGELVPLEPGPENPNAADAVDASANSRYVFNIQDRWNVDAATWGNETRFINHHCAPNLKSVVIVVGGRRLITFRALRAIKAGEELTMNYGDGYFQPGEQCYCNVNGGVKAHDPRPRG